MTIQAQRQEKFFKLLFRFENNIDNARENPIC